MIVYPQKFKVSKSLRQKINRGDFDVKFDTNFNSVIRSCSHVKREGQAGTWITDEMIMVYTQLHKMGIAHSVETYYDDELVGGLYGLSLGRVFCGESMFHKVSDASKVAFYYLVEKLTGLDYSLIDAQVPTNHLKTLGGEELSRKEFLKLLSNNISLEILW
jgi:leucyl/phenylalanyl-tRNA--protein transferase